MTAINDAGEGAGSGSEPEQARVWLEAAVTARREQARWAFDEYQAIAELYDLVLAEIYDAAVAGELDVLCAPLPATALRVAVAYGVYQQTAAARVGEALAARERLPVVAGHLRCGQITRYMFETVVSRTDTVIDPKTMAVIDGEIAELLGWTGCVSTPRLRHLVDRVLLRRDPDAVREREERARKRLNARARDFGDGIGGLVITATAEDIQLALAAINALANGVCEHDPRTKGQRRSAAALARLSGYAFTCECRREDCAASIDDGAVSTRQARIVLHAICDSSTLTGGASPGWFDGHGVLSADRVREIATRKDCTVRPLDLADLYNAKPPGTAETRPDGPRDDVDPPRGDVDPPPGNRQSPRPDDPGASPDGELCAEAGVIARTSLPSDPYRASTTAETVIRSLFGTCTIPGCTRRAWDCDIDHVEEFNHFLPTAGGPTCICNQNPKCRFHHLVKTHSRTGTDTVGSGWLDDQWVDEAGTVWTSVTTPEGVTTCTSAMNQWLFDDIDFGRCIHQSSTGSTADTPPPSTPTITANSSTANPTTADPTAAKHAWRKAQRARTRRQRTHRESGYGPPPF